jgi:hypothetical protein
MSTPPNTHEAEQRARALLDDRIEAIRTLAGARQAAIDKRTELEPVGPARAARNQAPPADPTTLRRVRPNSRENYAIDMKALWASRRHR